MRQKRGGGAGCDGQGGLHAACHSFEEEGGIGELFELLYVSLLVLTCWEYSFMVKLVGTKMNRKGRGKMKKLEEDYAE